jgi:phenylpyruvate tautomerase PptA (4-oxalocrotonate tautomerase family)
MPLIKVTTSVKCGDAQKLEATKSLSRIAAEGTGKPETYVQSVFQDGATISIGGEIKECAFVEVKGIGGLERDMNARLSEKICGFLNSELGIDPACVYINFTPIEASKWGWNNSTFG